MALGVNISSDDALLCHSSFLIFLDLSFAIGEGQVARIVQMDSKNDFDRVNHKVILF